MVNNKTVVVLGAGASSEVDLPTGEELKGRISKLLNFKVNNRDLSLVSGDGFIREALQHRARGNTGPKIAPGELSAAALAISAALPLATSIDNYLDSHRGNEAIELCGKLAIVQAIIRAEGESAVYTDPTKLYSVMDLEKVRKTWFAGFFQILTENAEAHQLEKRLRAMAFVIFNYDRCFEQFLYQALQGYYYKMPRADAAALVSSLEIYHPYGSVGALPWQSQSKESADFGESLDSMKLLKLSQNIKTFTEGADPAHSDIGAIRESFLGARIIVFLGFAFHKLNIELMHDPRIRVQSSTAEVYGTAWQVSKSDLDIISENLVAKFGVYLPNIHLRSDKMCADLFKEYRRTLGLT